MDLALRQKATVARTVVFWGTLCYLWLGPGFPLILSFIFSYAVYLLVGGYKFAYLCYRTSQRDLRGLIRLIQVRIFIHRAYRKNYTVGHLFQDIVKKHPEKPCLLYEDQKWNFREVEEFSNRVANCFSELGFRQGDDVALFMEPRPEFVAIWLGLSKIGVVPGLINTNLRLQSLVHSVTVVKCKAVIFGSELQSAIKDIAPELKEEINAQFFCYGDFDPVDFPAKSLDLLLQESSPHTPTNVNEGNFNDRLFYVYTSGTTGLPKAAIIRHSRFMWIGAGLRFMVQIKDDDVIYTALPLYHTAGGVISLAQTLMFGNTVAIRSKFSASRFWDDCVKYNATVSQYIGEVCRYLLAQPERPSEQQHKVRMMFGNGLRPQIWTQFMERFHIKHIGELYGSTEGNTNVINFDNKVGSVGFLSLIIPSVYPVTLIKVDPITGEPFRDEDGLCIRCKPGEPGEFVGKIIHNDPVRSFDGYVNRSATSKKIVRDVFRKGDLAFLSGDLLTMDRDGYLYFLDRTGDTFRWKGENVSTAEVEAIISNLCKLSDSVVYGVEVAGAEGRAGMVALHDPDHSIDLDKLLSDMRKTLPSYAVPIFLRIVETLETTGTYKLKKVDLQKEGFNPRMIKEPLYFLNFREGRYLPLDDEAYSQICEGKIKL